MLKKKALRMYIYNIYVGLHEGKTRCNVISVGTMFLQFYVQLHDEYINQKQDRGGALLSTKCIILKK